MVLGFVLYGPVLAEPVASGIPTDPPDGEKLDVRKGLAVYKSACIACHATGKDGAPRLHALRDWENRSFPAFAAMEKHAEKGFLKMPAKGKHSELSRGDIANAVYYMEQQIQAKQTGQ